MLTAVLVLLTVLISDSHQQCFTNNDAVPFIAPSQLSSWVTSRQNFSVSLFKVLNKRRRQQNILFSPWSIQETLLLAYFGAAKETEASIARVLQIPAKQKKPVTWHFYSKRRVNNIRRLISNFPIKSANRIFLSNKLRLRRCMQEKFEYDLELIDYRRDSAEWAKSYINNWVETETDGQIKDLIQDLSPSSTATLVNAIYFKSRWLYQFDPKETLYIQFHVNPYDTRIAKVMVRDYVFEQGRSANLGARMLLLPYKENKTAMIILLPDKDLDAMIESLNDVTLGFITNRNNYQPVKCKIVIPKFEHNSNTILNSALATLGIGKTLTRSADFSGFTGKKEVFFDEVVHEAVIQVDEEGTAATAATTMQITNSMTHPKQFVCDRPFAYVIYDFVESKVLFMGTFRVPKPV